METTEIKTELHNAIDSAAEKQLQTLYGLITNYLNGEHDLDEWELMPEGEKVKTLISLDHARQNNGNTLGQVTERLKAKYNR